MSVKCCVCWGRETRNVEIGRVLCYCGRRLYMLSNIRIGRIRKRILNWQCTMNTRPSSLKRLCCLAERRSHWRSGDIPASGWKISDVRSLK